MQKLLLRAALIGIAVTLLVFFPDREDGSGSILGGISAFIASAIGLAAVAKVRPLPGRTMAEHTRLALFAVGAGVAVGLLNLGANVGMSQLDPAIREQMVTRWAEFSVWSVVFAGPIMEEIGYRLVLLSGLAWIVSRFTQDRKRIFVVALAVSALLFGVAHIFYGGVDAPVYAVGMAIKSTAGGVAFGAMFWHWGLPYAMLGHCVANATHLLLMPGLF